MVLFTYICRVASNEQVMMKVRIKMLPIIIVRVVVTITAPFYITELNKISETLEPIFSQRAFMLLSATIVYLLITLFVCVRVSQLKFGPVRAKKN